MFTIFLSKVFRSSRGTIFDGVRARLRKAASSAFCTKSYYPLVGGTSPIPLNKLNAWLRNSYELLYFAVGYFFRNENRGEPISLKRTDSPLELSSDIVFSDTFLLLLFITFKELVDIIFCSLNLLHVFLNLTIFTVQLFLFCKDLGILCTEIFYLMKLLQMKLIKRHSWQPYEAGFPVCALPGTSCYIRIYDNPRIRLLS